MLFDLAYFNYRRFALIGENDGYFVSRLKQNSNPVITAELREWRDRAVPLEDKQLRAVLDDLDRKYIDVEIEVEFKRGRTMGHSRWTRSDFASSASSLRTTTTICI